MDVKTFVVILGIVFVTLSSASKAQGLQDKQTHMKKAINVVKRVAYHLSSLVVYVPPVVRECIWELTCLVTEKDNLSKCAWYVIRCVSKHVTGITSCLYDLGGDVAINIAYYGENFWEYDYGQIIWDVLSCAGLDKILEDFGLDIIRKTTK